MTPIPPWKDKVLFTPGPLTTSATVKQAMLRDWGSRDHAFIQTVREIREKLVQIAGGTGETFTTVLMQGSGTFGVEAVLSSAVRPGGKVLIVTNGAYGKRLAQIVQAQRIEHVVLSTPENEAPDPAAIDAALAKDPKFEMVAVVHCETTTGLYNPIEKIGNVVQRHGRRYFVDAMSSFGAVPIDVARIPIDYLVSSANKCIEGVPGFSFAICKLDALRETKGWARSLSLDLHAQWVGLETNGQFRFTPPTHALLAFRQALAELETEGGVAARAGRYKNNHRVLMEGMTALGFEPYLPAEKQGYIITSFKSPEHPAYDFEEFYQRLSDRGYVIYPGKVSDADCFRIGHIGRVFESDVRDLLAAIADVMRGMKIELSGARL